jgi:uncharacterized DUF497 family protein
MTPRNNDLKSGIWCDALPPRQLTQKEYSFRIFSLLLSKINMFWQNVNFEFDPDKSLANKNKHGIDFEQAQKLWLDPRAVQLAAKHVQEPRFALIAKLDARIWFAVYTMRPAAIRIITVRRARQNEKDRYRKSD